MAYSYNLTIASPGQSVVPITVPYIAKQHCYVEVNGVEIPYATLTWLSASTVQLPAPLVGGESVKAGRRTPSASAQVTFSPGNITSKMLNDQTLQLLYLTQESLDVAAMGLVLNDGETAWEARGLRLTNVLDPVALTDAATKGYVDMKVAQAASVLPDIELLVDTLMVGDYANDFASAMSDAIDLAEAFGATVVGTPGKKYTLNKTIRKTDKAVRIDMRGALIERDVMAVPGPALYIDGTFGPQVPIVAIAETSLYTGYPATELIVNSLPANGNTLTIANRLYTWATVAGAADTIVIGGSVNACLDNVIAAIMATPSGAGIQYGNGTVRHARVSAKRSLNSGLAIQTAKVTSLAYAVPTTVWVFSDTAAGVAWDFTTASTPVHRIQFATEADALLAGELQGSTKLITDTKIPWDVDANNERLAETVEVACVEGVNLYMYRQLRVFQFAVTNLRAAKMLNKKVVDIKGFYANEGANAPIERRDPMIRIEGCIKPKVWAPKSDYLLASLMSIKSCVQPFVWGLDADHGRVSLPGAYNSFTYGVILGGNTDAFILFPKGGHVRHVTTTEGSDIAVVPSLDTLRYGGEVAPRIVGCEGVECEHSPIDFHPDCALGVYENASSKNNYRGHYAGVFAAQIRGWRNDIIGLTIEGFGCININVDNGIGEHRVMGVVYSRGLSGNTGTSQLVNIQGKDAATYCKVELDFDSFRVDEFAAPLLWAEFADVKIKHLPLDYKPTDVNASPFYLKDCNVEVDDMVYDTRRQTVTAGAPVIVRTFGSNAKLLVRKFRQRGTISWRYANFSSFTNCEYIFEDAEVDVLPGGTLTGPTADGGFLSKGAGCVGWSKTRAAKGALVSPRNLEFAFAANGTKLIEYAGRGEDQLVVAMTITSPADITLGIVPPPQHADQKLMLFVTPASTKGANVLATGGTTNIVQLANVLLAPSATKRYFAYGSPLQWVAE